MPVVTGRIIGAVIPVRIVSVCRRGPRSVRLVHLARSVRVAEMPRLVGVIGVSGVRLGRRCVRSTRRRQRRMRMVRKSATRQLGSVIVRHGSGYVAIVSPAGGLNVVTGHRSGERWKHERLEDIVGLVR